MVTNAITEVFTRMSYLFLAGIVALLVFAFAVWLPNAGLLLSLAADPAVPLAVKILFPISLFGSITTNFTALAASYTVAIAVLTGLNVALLAYYVRKQRQLSQGSLTVGTAGVLSGILGTGCAACGSLVLTSLIGTASGLGLTAVLPLHGGEFGVIGVLLSGTATYLLAKQLSKPAVCEVPITS